MANPSVFLAERLCAFYYALQLCPWVSMPSNPSEQCHFSLLRIERLWKNTFGFPIKLQFPPSFSSFPSVFLLKIIISLWFSHGFPWLSGGPQHLRAPGPQRCAEPRVPRGLRCVRGRRRPGGVPRGGAGGVAGEALPAATVQAVGGTIWLTNHIMVNDGY